MHTYPFRPGGLLVLAALLPLIACGAGDPGDPPPDTDTRTSAETTGSPATEGTGPETPRTGDGEVSVSLPGLPVGGGADDSGQVRQCVTVAWMGEDDIPDDVAVVVAGVQLTPPGVFEADGSGCGGIQGCTESFAFTSTGDLCTVPVRALGTGGATAELRLSGSARCGRAETCRAFAGTVSGQAIDLEQPYEESQSTSSEEPPPDEDTTTPPS